jgi:hypothetical protein
MIHVFAIEISLVLWKEVITTRRRNPPYPQMKNFIMRIPK